MSVTIEKYVTSNAVEQNEERLRFALEASNHGIWDWNIATGELYFSPSWKRLFGFAENELTNHIEEWQNRIHPDDKDQLVHDLKVHFESNQPTYENCYRFRVKDGSYRWIQGRGKIVARAADGTPLRMIGTHTDVTEKKESEEQYRELFDLTPQPTWIYDFDTWQFLAVNQVAIERYGYSKEEFLRMTIMDIRPPEYRKKLEESLPFREQQDKIVKAPWIHQKKNGDSIVVELNSTTISYQGRKARLVVVNDITEKVAAEAELKRNHQWFQYVTKATSDAIYDLDLLTNHLTWGEGLTTLFGYAPHDISMADRESYVHPEDRPEVLQSLYETIHHSRKKFWKREYRFLTRDGIYRYVIDKGFILRDAEHQPLRMIGAMQDITNFKQQQLELAESNKRYEYATLAISDIIWDWVLEKGCVLWSDNYEKVTGWKLPENKCLPVETCLERFHENDRERVYQSMTEALANKTQHVWDAELKYLKSNGEIAHVYNRAYIIRNEAGDAIRMIGAMQDITQRKKLEEQLLHEELNKQKEISKATIDTQEQERGEIGRELHDNVNQVLTTTKLYLELAQSHGDLKNELLEKSQKNIVYVINEIRQLSLSLMNPSLGDLGLTDAIHDLIENVQATGKLKVKFETPGVVEPFPDNLELTIYRITQEALNNVVRHAQATTVCIFLEKKNNSLELRIEDNGIGFDPKTVKKGTGLKNMQNRVYLANGQLHVKSKPGVGSGLFIHFNL